VKFHKNYSANRPRANRRLGQLRIAKSAQRKPAEVLRCETGDLPRDATVNVLT